VYKDYQLSSCPIDKLTKTCPGVQVVEQSGYEYASMESLSSIKSNFMKKQQYIFNVPVTYFLHIDFEFRITNKDFNSTENVCALNLLNLFQMTEFCREIIFRFYRVC
jgi:hypothetical protein